MKNILVLFIIFTGSLLLFSSCQKEVSNETGVTQVAEGSLSDSMGNCSPDSVIGTYYSGITPGKDTAYVQVQVNVTKVGAYTISTNLQNGFQFADSGFFTTTGLNTVLLKPIGTPIIPVTAVFSVMFDSSLCNFTVDVLDSTGTGIHSGGGDTTGTGGDTTITGGDPDAGGGSWQFTQNNFTFSGSFDSVSSDNSTGLANFLYFSGSSSTGDTILSLQFTIPSSSIKTGTYTMVSNAILFSVGDSKSIVPISSANAFVAGTDMTVVITSYDDASKVVKGTFSGKVQNQSNAIVPLTSGSFTATVSP